MLEPLTGAPAPTYDQQFYQQGVMPQAPGAFQAPGMTASPVSLGPLGPPSGVGPVGAPRVGAPLATPEEEEEWGVKDNPLWQFVRGGLEGFTTIEVGDDAHSNNVGGQIAYGLGRAIGFLGVFVPGPGLLAKAATKLGVTGAMRLFGARRVAASLATRAAATAGQPLVRHAARSVPFQVADRLMGGVGAGVAAKVAQYGAGASQAEGISRALRSTAAFVSQNPRASFVAGEAVRQGLAQGVAEASPLGGDETFVQGAVGGFTRGALDGGVFGAANIGITKALGRALTSSSPAARDRAHMVFRAGINAAWGYGESTVAGDTLPMTAYHTALGAVFGIVDRPYSHTAAMRFLEAQRGPDGTFDDAKLARPQDLDGYAELDPAVREQVDLEAEQFLNRLKVRTQGLAALSDGSAQHTQAVALDGYAREAARRAREEAVERGVSDAEADLVADEAYDLALGEGALVRLRERERAQVAAVAPELLDTIDAAAPEGQRAAVLFGPHRGSDAGEPVRWDEDAGVLRVDPVAVAADYAASGWRAEEDPTRGGAFHHEYQVFRMLEAVAGEAEARSRLDSWREAREAEEAEISPETSANFEGAQDTGQSTSGDPGANLARTSASEPVTHSPVRDVFSLEATETRTRAALEARLQRFETVRQAADEHDVPGPLQGPVEQMHQALRAAASVTGRVDVGGEGGLYDAPLPDLEAFRSLVYRQFSEPSLPRGDDGRLTDEGWDRVATALNTWAGGQMPTTPEALARAQGPVGEAARSLRRAWKTYHQAVPFKQGVLSFGDGRVRLYGDDGTALRNEQGEIVREEGAPTYADVASGASDGRGGYVRISQVELADAYGRVTGRPVSVLDEHAFDSQNGDGPPVRRALTWGEAALAASRSGMPLLSGAKDKGVLLLRDGWTVEGAPGTFERAAQTKLLELENAAARARDEGFEAPDERAAYEREIAAMASDLVQAAERRGEVMPEAEARDLSARLWLEAVAERERVGRFDLATMAYESYTGRAQHLGVGGKGAVDYNKRAQVLHDRNPVASRAWYGEAQQAAGGFRTAIVDDADILHAISSPVLGVDGQPQARVARLADVDVQTDGEVYVAPDVFDRMLADTGGAQGAGMVKASFAAGDDRLGLLVGKQKLRPAPPRMAAMMRAEGLDVLMTTNSAKVRGRRAVGGLRVDGQGNVRLTGTGGQRPGAFVVPFDGVRFNTGVREDPAAQIRGGALVPRQMLANVENPAARRAMYDALVRPSVEGDPNTNRAFWEAVGQRDPSRLGDDFDVEQLGVREIMYVLSQPGEARLSTLGGVYGRVVGPLLTRLADDPSLVALDDAGSTVSEAETAAALRGLAEFRGPADRLLAVAGADPDRLVTPALVNMEAVRPYVETVLGRYVMARAVSPKTRFGWKGYLEGVDPEAQARFGPEADVDQGRVTPGHLYLGEAWRAARVQLVDGSVVSLEEAHSRVRSGQEPAETLDFLTVRVPADSKSGTRALRFGGFTGRRGAGLTVHDRDLAYLGGADLDGDSAFFFQASASGGRAVVDAARRAENEWDGPDGRVSDPKTMDDTFVEADALPETAGTVAASVSPRRLFASAQGARLGNQTLGGAATTGVRGSVWWDAARSGDRAQADAALDVYTKKGHNHTPASLQLWLGVDLRGRVMQALGAKWEPDRLARQPLHVRLVPAESKRPFEELRRQAMNYAADAGDYAGLQFTNGTIGKRLARELVSGVEVSVDTPKGRRALRLEPDEVERILAEVTPARTALWSTLREAYKMADGRRYDGEDDFSRPVGIDEGVEALGALYNRIAPVENASVRALAEVARAALRPGEEGRGYEARTDATADGVRQGHLGWIDSAGADQLVQGVQRAWGVSEDPEAQSARQRTGRQTMAMGRPSSVGRSWAYNQDLADVASAGLLKRLTDEAAAAGVTDDQMRVLAERGQRVRDEVGWYWAEKKRTNRGEASQERAEPLRTPEAVLAEAEAFGATLLPEQRALWEGHLVSSLTVQRGALDETAPADRAEWYRTGLPTTMLAADAVSTGMLGRWLGLYTDAVGLANRGRGDGQQVGDLRTDAARLVGMNREPIATPEQAAGTPTDTSTDTPTPEQTATTDSLAGDPVYDDVQMANAVADGFLDDMVGRDLWRLAGEAQVDGARVDAVQAGELRRLFQLYPEVARRYDRAFAGVIAQKREGEGELGVGIGVTPSRAGKGDVETFVRAFKKRVSGQFVREQVAGAIERGEVPQAPAVPKAAYWLFPRYTDRFLRRYEAVPEVVTRHILTQAGPSTAKVVQFTSTMRQLQELGLRVDEAKESEISRAGERRNKAYAFLRSARPVDGGADPDLREVHRTAVALMEYEEMISRQQRGVSVPDFETYRSEWRQHEPTYRTLKDRQFTIPARGGDGALETVTGAELVRRVQSTVGESTRAIYDRWVRPSSDAWERIFVGHRGADGKVQPVRYVENEHGVRVPQGVDARATLERLMRAVDQTGRLPNIGIDGLAVLTRALETERMTVDLPTGERTTIGALRRSGRHAEADDAEARLDHLDRPVAFTGYQEGYFPHIGHNDAAVRAHIEKQVARLREENAGLDALAVEQIERDLRDRIAKAYASGVIGSPDDLAPGSDTVETAIQSIVLGAEAGRGTPTEQDVEAAGTRERPGNLRSRTPGGTIPGWDKTSDALADYESRLVATYHRRLGALMHAVQIDRFEERAVFGVPGRDRSANETNEEARETTTAWARFLRLKARDMLGYPAYFPPSYLDDPDLGLKGNPYMDLTEHALERRARWADAKMLGGRMFGQESREAINNAGADWRQVADEFIGNPRSQRFNMELARFSRLEAKWALLSLLARPKAYVYNMAQASNTLISAGYSPTRRSMRLEEVRRLNPAWESWADVRAWAEGHGVVQSMLAGEDAVPPNVNAASWRAYLSDSGRAISNAWRKKTDVDDLTLREIARSHGVLDAATRFGAGFMQASERTLRMHAFVAHYMKAREVYEANGFSREESMPLDDPLLIDMARKGVRATQFVYNASARPSIANTALGRVLSRFQMWSWSSTAFQRRVYEDASRMGFERGTDEHARFERMATANVVAMALAGMFPASIFSASLPQPLGWMKEIAEYFFGDEDENSRAMNPLQMLTPPATRILTAPSAVFELTTALVNGGDPYASYQAWSLLPFGLLARDAGMMARSPMSAVDRLTGVPLFAISREARDYRARTGSSETSAGDQAESLADQAALVRGGGLLPTSPLLP